VSARAEPDPDDGDTPAETVGTGDGASPAEAVADAVSACPGVVRLGTASAVEVATYLPGRRVHGVRLRDDAVEVHVVARPGTVLPELADAIRRAVTAVVPAPTVDVYIDDLDTEPEGETEPGGDGEQSPPGRVVPA
jgi:hypothetical protein